MRFNIFKEARVSLYIVALIMSLFMLFYFFASMFTSMGYKRLRSIKSAENVIDNRVVIILDAGHGGEDPGAVSGDLIEKELNLDFTVRLYNLLNSCGYNAVLTRTDDRLLYDEGQENRKKYHDLRNRADFVKKYPRSIFVSIHMNKFSAEYCKGLQTFYSENDQRSAILAEDIQKSSKLLQSDNKREIKSGSDTIFLLENITIPAVLVECGFISNSEEALLLKQNEYKAALTLSIYCGIAEFTEKFDEN